MDFAKAARDPWVWGQVALMLGIGVGAPLVPRFVNLGSADFMLNRVDPVRVRWWGGLLLLAGGLLLSWGALSLGCSLTPGTEPLPEGELVTSGAYAHVRHPIYAGAVLLLAGYTLAWSNWTLALLVGVVALQFFKAKGRREEEYLVQRFPQYRSYRWQVRRMVL
jgi:protein-S-isoprenylcysteine O-methyltransferase Ste14